MAIYKPQNVFSGPPPVLYGCNFLDINGDNINFTFTPTPGYTDLVLLPNIKTTMWRDISNNAFLELLYYDDGETLSVRWSIRQQIPNTSPVEFATLYSSDLIIEFDMISNITYSDQIPKQGFNRDYETLLGQWYWFELPGGVVIPGYVQGDPVGGSICLFSSCSNTPESEPFDEWVLSSTEYPPTNTYYCNNNKIYYDRSSIDKNVPNQLDEQDKLSSNFRYPDDIFFGFNYNRANNRTYGVDNFNAGITYKLFLDTFVTE